MLNRVGDKAVRVVLFTWPSDGQKIPWWSYFSDRNDARASADAVGRAFLKLRDYLIEARIRSRPARPAPCDGSIGETDERLPEMARTVTIYHNRGDLSMPVSDYTKWNTDRLGWGGPSRPADLDGRVHAVDCSPIVQGFVEHSYYRCGLVNADIRQCIDDVAPDDPTAIGTPSGMVGRMSGEFTWTMMAPTVPSSTARELPPELQVGATGPGGSADPECTR